MNEFRVVDKAEADPLAREGGIGRGEVALPGDFLLLASRRLGIACLIYAVGFTLAYFVATAVEWIQLGIQPKYFTPFHSAVALVSIALGLGMFILTRRTSIPPQRLLDLGLIFEVVGGIGIGAITVWGVYEQWQPEWLDYGFSGIPWECVWIIMFPLMAPNDPRKVLAASLATASVGPVLVFVSRSVGATSSEVPTSHLVLTYLFSTYLCAGIAYFMSRWIRQFAIRLQEAREIGQYRLMKLIGRGGMGEVWHARHRMLVRPAAIKLIRPEVFGRSAESRVSLQRRFEREAQAAALLQSAHTIAIYDFGVTGDGTLYTVMELLRGLDMNTFVERFGPIRPERLILWLRQACHSLRDAHDRGLVHRDIKPSNLFVCHQGPDYDFIKVLDFGLVKPVQRVDAEALKLTREDAIVGTPAFMAPEMALDEGETDARTDIYALGCLAYYLLTGQPVFEDDTPLATVIKHIREAPVPPSQRSETPVPDDLEAIILECLAKSPDDRPQSVRELAARLAACRDAGRWTEEAADAWWRLHLPEGWARETGGEAGPFATRDDSPSRP